MTTEAEITSLQEQNKDLLAAKKEVFLQAYVEGCTEIEAAKKAGIHWSTAYTWIHKDPDFAERYQAAKWMSAAPLVKEAERRGFKGINRPLSHQGKLTGDTVREYSDNLLMFTIKGKREEYRDSSNVTVNNLQIEGINAFKQALALGNQASKQLPGSTENHEEAQSQGETDLPAEATTREEEA